MARGINKVILVGNLGDDPETKYTQGGMAVTTIRLATTSVRKDKDGQTQKRTEWHRVKFFGKLGEIAGEYLRKGRQVYVEGSLQTREWTDRDGNKRYTTEVRVQRFQMLGGRPGDERQPVAARGPMEEVAEPEAGFGEDDIPFSNFVGCNERRCGVVDPATGCVRGSGSTSDRLDRLGVFDSTQFRGVDKARLAAEAQARRRAMEGTTPVSSSARGRIFKATHSRR